MRDITVNSWEELHKELYAGGWSENLQRFKSPYLFRGQSNKKYKLETTLMRLGGPYGKLEPHLLRNFKKYAQSMADDQGSIWNWLSLAQHHGLPTRLLDWTYSPLVALHFATADIGKFDVDGLIWKVNYLDVHQYLPQALKNEMDRINAYAFDTTMLASVVESLEDLDRISPTEFALFFEPPSLDDRIINQFALFSIMSSPTARLDDWLIERAEQSQWMSERIIIPASIKWEIRDKLDQSNISERVLFPGLDGISSWLKRNYSPKKP